MKPTNHSGMFSKQQSLDKVRLYEKTRFQASNRMRTLDTIEKNFAEELMTLVGSEGTIADIPCGSGRFTPIFQGAKKLYNIDLSENMLQTIQEKFGTKTHIDYLHASATDIPLADDSVDLAFCMRLLHHISSADDRLKVLSELDRISRRWIAVSYYRKECFRYFRKKLLFKKTSGNPIWTSTFKAEAESLGLGIVKYIPSYLNGSSQTLVLLKRREDA